MTGIPDGRPGAQGPGLNSGTGKMVLIMLLAGVYPGAKPGNAVTVEGRSAYTFDFLVTENFEAEAGIGGSLTDALEAELDLQYLDATQDSISGLKRLEARVYSLVAGAKLGVLNPYTSIDINAGFDYIENYAVKPRARIGLTAGIPLPPGTLFKNLRLRPEAWFTYRKPMAAMIRNHVSSSGWTLDVMGGLGNRMGYGGNYREEYMRPDDPELDTSLFQTVPGGVPVDTLHDNKLVTFYVYVYGQVTDWLTLSYAFSLADAREDRWVVTRSEPVYTQDRPRRHIGTQREYAYYPYPTTKDGLSHILGADVKKNWGPAGFRLKVGIPVYSQREIFDSPAYVDEYQGNYYTQKHTGPLTLEAELNYLLVRGPVLALEYEFFSLPYTKWAYFTSNKKSYSYHKLGISVKKDF